MVGQQGGVDRKGEKKIYLTATDLEMKMVLTYKPGKV